MCAGVRWLWWPCWCCRESGVDFGLQPGGAAISAQEGPQPAQLGVLVAHAGQDWAGRLQGKRWHRSWNLRIMLRTALRAPRRCSAPCPAGPLTPTCYPANLSHAAQSSNACCAAPPGREQRKPPTGHSPPPLRTLTASHNHAHAMGRAPGPRSNSTTPTPPPGARQSRATCARSQTPSSTHRGHAHQCCAAPSAHRAPGSQARRPSRGAFRRHLRSRDLADPTQNRAPWCTPTSHGVSRRAAWAGARRRRRRAG